MFVIGFAPICFPQDQNEIELRQRVQEYENAYNKGDAKALAAIYTMDASHTYAIGITHRGRVEIEKGLEEFFTGMMKGTQMKLTPEVIRFPKDDIAIENASFIMTGLKVPDGSEVPSIKGLCLAMYQKIENEWFVVAVQCMVLPPQN
jgi:uncharacterized protein (TIGR02246 family)